MAAVMKHDLNTVQTLLQHPKINKGSFFGFGKNPLNYADEDGNTALMHAIKDVRCRYRDNEGYNICMNSQKIIKVLLETPGIDTHHVNKKGETAITLYAALEQ